MANSTDFLVDDAYRKVWCSPGQDRQFIVAPTRMTKRQGVIGSAPIGMRQYSLPTAGEWYHLFAINDLPPSLVGMDIIVDKWVSMRGQCVATSMLIDLYLNDGRHLPLHRAYFLWTAAGALIIAIKHTPQIAHLGVVQPFLRWRSNAWFERPDSNVDANTGIEIEGLTPTNTNDFYVFQAKWKAAKLKQGYAWAFVNGRRVKDLNLTTLNLGDHVEYYQDKSVKEVLEIPVNTLLAFTSILDSKGKYLLPRPGLGTTIDFCDDVDIYLLRYELAARYSGCYYHANQPDAVRMVTHRDLSIVSAYLRGYVDDNASWAWGDDLRVEVIVRNSGWIRELSDEAHRIKELFKLPEDKRLKAMIGADSLDVWTAANLENSQYTQVMRTLDGQMTRDLVEQAYGYNAISRILGDTPVKVDQTTNKWIDLPFGLIHSATAFEYGADGRLLGWYIHDQSIQYPIRNPATKYVEAYSGKGGVGISTEFDEATSTLVDGIDYRFYLSDIVNGVHQNNWRDVTGDATKYTVTNKVVTWFVDRTKFSTAVKNSRDFLAYTFDVNYRDDLLAFTLNATEVRVGRVPATGIVDIPFGQVDIWMNGFALVPEIDYYENFPEFCIVNRAYLVDGPVQSITVRGRGFCHSDMSSYPPHDSGFVAYGTLSHNTRFQVRDDKVCYITIGGQLYTRDEVGFSEDGSLITADVPNGIPYKIVNPIISMMGTTNTDTYTMMAASEAIDKEVEDYLTLMLPEPVQANPNPIPQYWTVFSPFTTKLIFDMLNGILPMDEFKLEYSDEWLRDRLAGYDWILPYDPALKDVDTDYVIIQPHPETGVISLNVYQYRVLDRAIRLFLNNNVELNRKVVVVEEGFEHDQRDHPHPHQTWSSVGLT